MTVKSGRYPKNHGEIALEQYAAQKYFKNVKIGDKISLNYMKIYDGDKENEKVNETWTVVGILNNMGMNDETGVSCGAISFDDYIKNTKRNSCMDYFRVKNESEIDTDIAYLKSDLIKISPKSTIEKNTKYFGALDMMNTINKFGIFLSIAVILCAIVVIYNIFHITVIQRIKDFSMLTAIGTDRTQIMMLVLGETLIISIFCIPVASLAGYFGIKYLFFKMITIDIGPVLTIKDIIMPVIVTLLAVFASSLSPALKASKISPVEGIKQSYNLNGRKKMKKSNISDKFGFPFSMALSNVSSNKKRFICTIVSFAFSIFMIICSVYIFNVFDPEIAAYRNTGGDILVKYDNMNYLLNCGCSEDKFNKIKDIDGIKNINKHRTFSLNLELNKDKLTTAGRNYYSSQQNKFPGFLPTTYSVGIDNNEFDNLSKYAEEGTTDFSTYDGKPEVIVVQNINYRNYTKYKAGDTVILYAQYNETPGVNVFKQTDKVKFKVGAVLRTSPIRPLGGDVSYMFIMSNSSMEKYFFIKDYSSININVKNEKDIDSIKSKISSKLSNEKAMYVTSIDEQKKTFEKMNYVVRTILLSFCMMLVVVSIVNIINTIGIGVLLRKRELGMLRAVGVSRSGIRKIITYEGMIYGIVSSIIGSVLSIWGTYLIYLAVRAEFLDNELYKIPCVLILLISAAGIAVSVLVSIPSAKKTTRETIVESIKTIE